MRVSSRLRRAVSLATLLVCVFAGSCAQRNANAVIIVNKDGVSVKGGKVEFVKDGPRMRADFWVPGNVVVYRIDATTGGGEKALAGKAYMINSRYKIDQVGSVDLSKSDEELCEQFGVVPGKK